MVDACTRSRLVTVIKTHVWWFYVAIRAKGRATVLVKYFTLDFTGATVLFFFLFSFFINDRCISRTRDTKVAVTTPYVKKGLQDRASSKKDSVLWSIDREEFVERSFIYNEDMDACVFHSSASFKDHKSHLRNIATLVKKFLL